MNDHNNSPEIIITGDGSHSLYLAELDETYHSRHGAAQESQYVFIDKGLAAYESKDRSIKILEVGFGTGLNALLTWDYAKQNQVEVEFHTLETHPLDEDLMKRYAEGLGWTEFRWNQFLALHSSEWNVMSALDDYFSLKKYHTSIQEFAGDENSFDLVYYDAFGPRAQPEMWDKLIFLHLFRLLRNNGLFVTYCAKGQVRRDLAEVGFQMERLPGPPGKREMLRGQKKLNS